MAIEKEDVEESLLADPDTVNDDDDKQTEVQDAISDFEDKADAVEIL